MDRDNDGMTSKADANKKGWKPSQAEDALTREERSLDIGESGQFAPGGYYNQQGINEPRRTLDDDVVPPGRNSRQRSVE
jgi:hypothetical protein